MAYVLETENRGQINAGYLGVITQEVRIGDFSIPTDEFCRFVSRLATGETSLQVPTTEGQEVEGSWDPQKKAVKIGGVEISAQNFGVFADYVFNGGWIGWKPEQPDWRPDFVREAVGYVRGHMGRPQPKDSYSTSVEQKELPRLEERF